MNNRKDTCQDGQPERLRIAYDSGFQAGVEAEHARVLSVHSASLEGHEALTTKMMLDGYTTEGEAAMAVIAAERDVLTNIRQADARARVSMAKAKWECDAALRGRFQHNYGRYLAYSQNRRLFAVED